MERRRYKIYGQVQGVGFRPFICRIASNNNILGWVRNAAHGVMLEIEGTEVDCDRFVALIERQAPPLARIENISLVGWRSIESLSHSTFSIGQSESDGHNDDAIVPDIATCDECLREMFDPLDRRHLHPFISCLNCGPRYSIARCTPYDRCNTTMDEFQMCESCLAEYHDINDRRFHAQTIGCWICGPRVMLCGRDGTEIPSANPIEETIRLLSDGALVAVKGVGGFHITCDPNNYQTVRALRLRKRRAHRPFALISASVDAVDRFAKLDPFELEALQSVARPIVILNKKHPIKFAENVAPNVDSFGVMLAYTPIHHLLLRGHFDALIATSANASNEPIAFSNDEAIHHLGAIVDFFLIHNRGIHRRVDDSIVQVARLSGSPHTMLIRVARGFTPTPFRVPELLSPVIAYGAEVKNTIAVSKDQHIFVSPHIGDLKNYRNYLRFVELVEHMLHAYSVEPQCVACDLHPEMVNSRLADESATMPVVKVQHHHAHMAACLMENNFLQPAIGVILDGHGYGTDGGQWGGEFLVGDMCRVSRCAHFLELPIPGADSAVQEPYRVAIALLMCVFGPPSCWSKALAELLPASQKDTAFVARMIQTGLNCPKSSSVGRLFDAVSALLTFRGITTYEGQSAVELEALAANRDDGIPLEYGIIKTASEYIFDWRPTVRNLIEEFLTNRANVASLSERFHRTLAVGIADICVALRNDRNVATVVLSGGVFLNRRLLAMCHQLLETKGFKVLRHSAVPTNDGGISFGQIAVANARLRAAYV